MNRGGGRLMSRLEKDMMKEFGCEVEVGMPDSRDGKRRERGRGRGERELEFTLSDSFARNST